MNHLVNDSKASSVTSIKTSNSSLLGVSGEVNANVLKNAADMTDGNTLARSTSDKYNTNIHKTDPSKDTPIIFVDMCKYRWQKHPFNFRH